MNIYTSETEYLKTEVQRLSALVRAQQITIDKLEAQLEQESVAWEISGKLTSLREVKGFVDTLVRDAEHNLRQLANTTPPQRTWVGLTQDEFRDFASTLEYGTGGLIRAIEAKLKEKNT